MLGRRCKFGFKFEAPGLDSVHSSRLVVELGAGLGR